MIKLCLEEHRNIIQIKDEMPLCLSLRGRIEIFADCLLGLSLSREMQQ